MTHTILTVKWNDSNAYFDPSKLKALFDVPGVLAADVMGDTMADAHDIYAAARRAMHEPDNCERRRLLSKSLLWDVNSVELAASDDRTWEAAHIASNA